jgi:hypothetical protein
MNRKHTPIPIFICLVCEDLCAMIGDDLYDPLDLVVVLRRLSHQVDAIFTSCRRKFSARWNKSRTIVEDHTDLFAIDLARVPIKMNCRGAVFSFISGPRLPAFLLFFSQLPSHFKEEPGGWRFAIYSCNICARLSFRGVLLRNLLFVDF